MALDEFGVSMSVEGIKQENYKNQNQNFTNPFGFTGYQSDNITNLYFAQARYYMPKIGRFNVEDPKKDQLNWYNYCNGNPITFLDPSGLVIIPIPSNDSIQIFPSIFPFWGVPPNELPNIPFSKTFNDFMSDLGRQIVESISDLFLPPYRIPSSFPSVSNTVVNLRGELEKIDGGFGQLECGEAAETMSNFLSEQGKITGQDFDWIILFATSINLSPNRNYNEAFQTMTDIYRGQHIDVFSRSKPRIFRDGVVSENGLHQGILFNGLVHCNVHPEGLEYSVWIDDFYTIEP